MSSQASFGEGHSGRRFGAFASMLGMPLFKREPKVSITSTRAAKMPSPEIRDSLEVYISSQGECLRRYEDEPNLLLLEILAENAAVVQTLVAELLSRAEAAGVLPRLPVVDPHVLGLQREFERRHAQSPAAQPSS